jgi:CheY-like chemotaxis protein
MAKTRVLLVDDERELVFTIAERLEMRGYQVDAVTDGAEALTRAAASAYDVAVVDVKMPGVSGLAVLRALRESQPRLPVILLTGHGSASDGEDGVKLGAAAYLFKPVKLADLIEAMTKATSAHHDH